MRTTWTFSDECNFELALFAEDPEGWMLATQERTEMVECGQPATYFVRRGGGHTVHDPRIPVCPDHAQRIYQDPRREYRTLKDRPGLPGYFPKCHWPYQRLVAYAS